MKKFIAAAMSAVISVSSAAAVMPDLSMAVSAEESGYNYGEALQKSMFFYQVQQSGELPEWNEVSWRDDSCVNDVVPGGWYDAGDHLKFSLTNAYTATMMSWGILQYKDAVKNAGLYESYLQNLQWGLDFVAACDLGDKVIGTIGDDAFDHVWWGSAEVYMRKYVLKGGTDPRPYDEITCTTTVAEMASAMAAGYLVFKDENPTLADSYLEHAKSLFELADTTRCNDDQGIQKSYYNTQQNGSGSTDILNYVDELMFAANWLYMATGEQSYLDLCKTDYIPNFPLESQSTEKKYTWGVCWDDVSQAAALLYAINTGEKEWINHVQHHLDYWTTGYGGKQVSYTPDGLAWLFNWGSLRHATTTSFIAMLACDTIFADDVKSVEKYNTWAKSQMDYAFGDNDLEMSYVLGMGDKNPVNVHHRTSSGIYDDHWNELGTGVESDKWETEYAHVLYGALEGGPNQDGTFTDTNASYQNTEVAIDYNAGFTAALCAMIDDYGGTPLEDFPQEETPTRPEFLIKASLNQVSSSFTELKVYAMNHSAWPARVIEDLSYNYYFDITELVEAGYSIDDVYVQKGTDQHSGDEGVATVSDPIQYDGNVYYVKITFGDGRVVMPTGQSEHRSELQFRIGIADTIQNVWDPTNDYSFANLVQGGEDAMIETEYITMYDGDKLIWGTEPNGKTADDISKLEGDVNLDGLFNVADLVKLNSYLVKDSESKIDKQGGINGDMNKDDKLNIFDSVIMRRKLI